MRRKQGADFSPGPGRWSQGTFHRCWCFVVDGAVLVVAHNLDRLLMQLCSCSVMQAPPSAPARRRRSDSRRTASCSMPYDWRRRSFGSAAIGSWSDSCDESFFSQTEGFMFWTVCRSGSAHLATLAVSFANLSSLTCHFNLTCQQAVHRQITSRFS